MPALRPKRQAEKAKREGKAPTTQAGAFVKEEMHALKRGKQNVTSRKQAVAIGLSKARQAGVKLPRRSRKPPRKDAHDTQ